MAKQAAALADICFSQDGQSACAGVVVVVYIVLWGNDNPHKILMCAGEVASPAHYLCSGNLPYGLLGKHVLGYLLIRRNTNRQIFI